VQSLYRGLTPNLLGNASSWAIFFYFKSTIEEQLVYLHGHGHAPLPHSASISKAETERGSPSPSPSASSRDVLTPADYFVASGISGTMITLLTNPIWVLKTRMLSSDRGAAGAYENMWQGARSLWAAEGARGFYRGAVVSLLGNSHGAVQFAVYEPLKRAWRRHLAAAGGRGNRDREADAERVSGEEKLGNSATLVISGAAKVVAGAVTYPYQVVRSRLQTYEAEERYGKGITGVVGKVWREDGWRGFYRGLGTNVFRVLPATWVTFLVYENARYYLPLWAG
jgi:solute carrier family 25 folate transporter 32